MGKFLRVIILLLSAQGAQAAVPSPGLPHPDWATYSDDTFGFLIRHPAPKPGQHAHTRPIPGTTGVKELPTGSDLCGVLLSVYTDDEIRNWNHQPGTTPFPYLPETLRDALESPVGTPFPEIENAIVIQLGNQKALRFIKNGPYGVQVTHFVRRGKNGWLEINLILWDDRNLAHLTLTRPVPYGVQKALDAAQAVLNTVYFFNPKALPRQATGQGLPEIPTPASHKRP